MKDDEGIRAVREIRRKIAAECDYDPEKLIEHYIVEQGRHGNRLLQPLAINGSGAVDAHSPQR